MQLTGFHHLTAVTADAPGNHRFYTGTLGLRLVKKTVNQDDVSAYHLFYGDGSPRPAPTSPSSTGRSAASAAAPSDQPHRPPRRRRGDASTGGQERLTDAGRDARRASRERAGRAVARLRGPRGPAPCAGRRRRRGRGSSRGTKSPVPAEHQIRGLGPITLTVPRLAPHRHRADSR